MDGTENGVRYQFTVTKPGTTPDLMKVLVALAIQETDLVFSRARRKLETGFQFLKANSECTIEGGTECGEHLAKLLSGFLIKQVGEDGFVVRRQYRKSNQAMGAR